MQNEFNYKNPDVILIKKDIFKFFINEIINQSKMLNQNVVFVTFNFKDDIKNPAGDIILLKTF